MQPEQVPEQQVLVQEQLQQQGRGQGQLQELEEEEVVERLQLLGVEEEPRLLVQHQPAQLPPRSLPLSLLADQ